MTFDTWVAFTIASAAVVLIPGPNIILTISYALRGGRTTGWATIPGVVAGAFVAMTLSLLGAGAVVTTSATLFTFLKVAGAIYLLWLAFHLWTSPADKVTLTGPCTAHSKRSMFREAFLVSILNPKGPIFYLAFVPQFINAEGLIFRQFVILIVTFLGVAAINGLIWLLFSSVLRPYLSKPKALKAVNRTGACCLFLAGVFTANASHSSEYGVLSHNNTSAATRTKWSQARVFPVLLNVRPIYKREIK